MNGFLLDSRLAKGVNERGSSLIEALIALVILGFGLLAIGKFQITLADAIGTGRDRVEALFLAQEEMERLRAFNVIDTTGEALDFAYADIVANTAPDNSNYIAAFNRKTTVTVNPISLTWSGIPSVTPDLKLVLIKLTWNNKQDKQDEPQTLTLPSVIAKHDPAAAAWLIACQTDTDGHCDPKDATKTPYNRSLRIPYPAKDLGGGKSVFAPPGHPEILITLDNATGSVIGASGSILPNTIPEGESYFLLTGYVRFGSGPSPASSITSPIDFLLIAGDDGTTVPAHECFDDSGDTSESRAHEDAITYSCLVKSNTKVNDEPAWSGKMRLTLDGNAAEPYGWTKDRVCGYPQTPVSYENVRDTQANQNYIIVTKGKNCDGGNFPFQP